MKHQKIAVIQLDPTTNAVTQVNALHLLDLPRLGSKLISEGRVPVNLLSKI